MTPLAAAPDPSTVVGTLLDGTIGTLVTEFVAVVPVIAPYAITLTFAGALYGYIRAKRRGAVRL